MKREKQSIAMKRWWAGLTQEERDEINRKRSEARKRFWSELSLEERSAIGYRSAQKRKENRGSSNE